MSKRKSTLFSNYSCVIIHRHVQIKNYYVLWTVSMCTTSLHSKFHNINPWYEYTSIIWMAYLLKLFCTSCYPRVFLSLNSLHVETSIILVVWGVIEPFEPYWNRVMRIARICQKIRIYIWRVWDSKFRLMNHICFLI